MLIQVTTKNSQKFWRAGIKFGPQPTRLWVGEGTPPDRRLRVITAAQFAKIRASSGADGPLFIEKDAPHLRSADATEALAERDARIRELESELARLREQIELLDVAAAEHKARADELRGALDEAHARIHELEQAYDAALEQVNTLEQAAADAQASAQKPEDKPRRGRNK